MIPTLRRATFAFVAMMLALGASRTPAATPGFTLDAVLAAPFSDDLVVSPRRDALAWTVHERGARNVVVWKDGAVRELTHETADDGHELGGLAFLPDSSAVVYERGSDGDASNANPAMPAQREPRRILLTSLAGGATLELGNGRAAAVSPKGDRVAWIGTDGPLSQTGQVMSAKIATRDGGRTWTATKAAVLFTVRGSADAPVWSPDGSRIAITNKRDDHAYIALYTLGAPNLTYALPEFSNDRDPVWSPDGSQIAFVRLPGDVSTLGFYDDPDLFAPWSIVVADAATGQGRVVWRAQRGRGNEFTIADGVQPLWWSRDGRLAFIWERDGWRHLYALPASGGAATLLTPGAFEIEQLALAADGNALLYTSNEGDLDARHVWRVPFAGGGQVRVSGGATNQWSPVELAGGRYAYFDASYDVPGTVTLAAPALAAPGQACVFYDGSRVLGGGFIA